EKLAEHVQTIRRENFPDYQIQPAGERDVYSAIIYIEPFSDRNLRAFGFDMLTEPVRRKAMEQARDENATVLSGKVRLIQETAQDVQAGTLMLIPVYRRGVPVETIAQRRAAIQGWVYSPYRMNDLMRGTLSDWSTKQNDRPLCLQVYDGNLMSADNLLYDSQHGGNQTRELHAPAIKLTAMDFAGRRWTLRFTQPAGLSSMADYSNVRIVVAGGLCFSLLLSALTLAMLNLRANLRQLHESEHKHRVLFENSPDACLMIVDGVIINCNRAAELMLRGDRKLIVGQMPARFSPEYQPDGRKSADFADEKIRDALSTGTNAFEWMHRRLDGTDFYVDVSLSTILMQGQTVLFASWRDITWRKRVEVYREISRAVLQILNQPGILQEALQRVVAVLKTQTGFDAVGLRLQKGEDFPFIAQEGFSDSFMRSENSLVERGADGGLCRDQHGNLRLACTCGQVISGATGPEHPDFTKSGSFWTNDSCRLPEVPANPELLFHPRKQCMHHGFTSKALIPVRSKDRIIGLIHIDDRRKNCFTLETVELLEGIASHIGEALMRKQAEADNAELETQNRQLQKAESLWRMAGAIAHHFNNQLMGVMGNLELALQDLPRSEDLYSILKAAMQSATQAAGVSSLMLTYLGQTSATHAILDLSISCRQYLPVLRAALPGNIVLDTCLPASGPVINGNENQIQQLLTILIVNAGEALETRAGTIRMAITAIQQASDIPLTHRFPFAWKPQELPYACLEVNDTGCGIADSDIDQIFDPFFTTKFTGRGLGLAVLLGIVRSHDGCITVESKPGRGSTFRVYLPNRTT
ncbi:MAG: CHASE domain-containing protein, partial [bacterium]